MVANPNCGQLDRKNVFFFRPRLHLKIWSRETGSAGLSHVSPPILHTQAEFSAFRDGVIVHIDVCTPSTAIGSVLSLSSHAIAYRRRSLPRVRRHRASRPHGSSSNGCCLLRFHQGPMFVPLFSQTHFGYLLIVNILLMLLIVMVMSHTAQELSEAVRGNGSLPPLFVSGGSVSLPPTSCIVKRNDDMPLFFVLVRWIIYYIVPQNRLLLYWRP